MKTKFTRRSFLKTTAVTAAAVSWSARSWSQVRSANDDVRVATVGFHGRGADHISGFSKVKGSRIAGLCDVDQNVLDKEKQKWTDSGVQVEAVTDLRRLLDSKEVDVITIATPNHWHSLATIWAVQAGKDVYVEKPVSHNVWEGRKAVEAARKYGRIVQTGTQCRSSFAIRDAFSWIKEGNLGKITISRGLCYKPRGSIGKVDGPQPIPGGVDYNLWSGPAPIYPIRRKQFHYDWHWLWPYGSGDLGNQGIHQMDICRWAIGANELSSAILSIGGRVGYSDDGQTANTQIVYHDYRPAPLIFEVRGLPSAKGAKNMDRLKGASVGCIIECEGGYVTVPNYSSATAHDKDGKEIKKWNGADNHFENFIKAVRSRQHTDLNADILEGHLSSALCHTGNISYRLGHTRSADEIAEAIKTNAAMTETFERMLAHLKANDVDLEVSKLTIGAPLTMDPKTERFIGDEIANAMLSRVYRPPFVVPEKV
jgi:predicted dehydrogenase